MSELDPSVTASYKVGLFGIPTRRETARIVLLPVPWEVTTSYGAGTADGPEAILKASPQIDLFDLQLGKSFERGYHMLPIPESIRTLNDSLKPKALKVRDALEERGTLNKAEEALVAEINAGGETMTKWVHGMATETLSAGQIPVVIGGDHSSPEGNIQAVCEKYPGEVGVLHFDAHADLREAYQGFTRSHASIMYNVMHAPWKPKQLVQVGIRDFSEEEYQLTQQRKDIRTFFDIELQNQLFFGTHWSSLCDTILAPLPKKVYVSFDIDGLNPALCPHTGTPVPGGLSFEQANFLLGHLVKSGRQIVGFDLNEVAPGPEDEWDANVGARLLYKMCGWACLSQKA